MCSATHKLVLFPPRLPSKKKQTIWRENPEWSNFSSKKSTFTSSSGLQVMMQVESAKNYNCFVAPKRKMVEHLDSDPRQLDTIVDTFGGRLTHNGLVFKQNLLIKSFELGSDGKVTMGGMLNHLQESAINHFKSAGLVAEGYGSTWEMSRRSLIWVVCKLQVEVDRYPSWADVLQINTWTCGSGKNGMRRDWLVTDYRTGERLIRAVSVYVIMNKKTRKLSKFTDEIRAETNPYFMDCDPIIDGDCRKLQKVDIDSADTIRSGLVSGWNDLDLNQHVSHIKYINWIIEGAPRSVLDSHWLSSMTLEYKKECGVDSVLQSLSAAIKDDNGHMRNKHELELGHSLCLANGSELIRGRTMWRPRHGNF